MPQISHLYDCDGDDDDDNCFIDSCNMYEFLFIGCCCFALVAHQVRWNKKDF